MQVISSSVKLHFNIALINILMPSYRQPKKKTLPPLNGVQVTRKEWKII
jgi:hypothetical protein